MSNRFDEISRIFAQRIPRRDALALTALTLVGSPLLYAQQNARDQHHDEDEDEERREGAFRAYANAIDTHLRRFMRFVERDARVRARILQDYAHAVRIREEYQTRGVIPADPLVELGVEGDNLFGMADRNVVILLAQDPTLEAIDITFSKPAGFPVHIVFVGGNPGFWQRQDPAAKFVSAAFTLPADETTLTIASSSFSIGKVIVVIGVAVLAVTVATKLRRRSAGEVVGKACACTFTCKARDGRTFTYTQRTGCCNPIEVSDGNCLTRCSTLSFSNGTVCTPVSSACVDDASCQGST